jgi:hypothetical protein
MSHPANNGVVISVVIVIKMAVMHLHTKSLREQQTVLIFRASFTAAIPPHH